MDLFTIYNAKRKKSWMKPGQPSTSTPKREIFVEVNYSYMLCIWWDHKVISISFKNKIPFLHGATLNHEYLLLYSLTTISCFERAHCVCRHYNAHMRERELIPSINHRLTTIQPSLKRLCDVYVAVETILRRNASHRTVCSIYGAHHKKL
ncbi:uncharacterized protein LOC105838006 [Monomorium pharaonis]|uniref:uncharacterized protein LOC105838006 n=1 Tax=Monomorium pharaonis TaxID=307658 RepID=UPI00063F3279|nr:uncharacterized protein LOC105838006 [Monomorium pharaonis]XP_036147658.1 uncharacterized protein LOC105838006 [Monomorium pharaonis]XP_036147659.1 uncharacterized protein LOC105838006 [Monomorium pharaonis]XP_036147660.1 uncharacterized protein LOC105838006 [Monomorium pharaonis]